MRILYLSLLFLSLIFTTIACQSPSGDAGESTADASEGAVVAAEEKTGDPGEDPHWCYTPGEPCGPEHWGHLQEEWSICLDGQAQSPVDLASDTWAESAPTLDIAYQETPVVVQNKGYTVEVKYASGSSLDLGDGRPYELLQFHFHNPSEHTVNGEASPMEVHLVHARPQEEGEGQELAVVGLLFEEGDANPFLAKFWDAIPSEEGEQDAGVTLNIEELLPERSYYALDGSLTTPGCGEGVLWFVLQSRVTASADQVARLNAAVGVNARPVQPLHGRKVLLGPAH